MAKKKTKDLDGIEAIVSPQSPDEQELIVKLFELADTRHNPFKLEYNKQIVECMDFVELRQWDGPDMQLLAMSGVPTIAVDRISRGIDTINGIRSNTGAKKKIVPRGLGDDRIASILDKTFDYVTYTGNFDEASDNAFDGMLKTGMGVRKFGWDASASGGEGEVWVENVDIEDVGWSKCRKKTLADSRWFWHRQVMDWENAIRLNPDKAGDIKAMKTFLATEWERQRSGNTKGSFAQDYSNLVVTMNDTPKGYPDQVEVWEFWLRTQTPYRKVLSIGMGPDGLPAPNIRMEDISYQPADGERALGSSILDEWTQYIIASPGGKRGGILLSQEKSEFDFSPFVGMCAEMKKNGSPLGFVERSIPFQKRINISWSQKTYFNNKSLKSPLAIKNADPSTFESKVQQSQIGAILFLEGNEEIVNVNTQPPVNLQAIEEGNVARQDMDFNAASSEPALTGAAQSGDSGIKLGMQQNAAVTPLNKWVKAEKDSDREFSRRVLQIIIKKINPQRMARIIGENEFIKLIMGPLDPMSNIPLLPPIPMPITLDVAHYDVIIQDSAVSDFQKSQSFSATEALVAQGVPMTDKFRIQNAPIKDTDAALSSNEEARNDIIQQLMQQIQMLESAIQQKDEQIAATEKMVDPEKKGTLQAQKAINPPAPKENNQKKNGARGKAQPQVGRQMMMGGTSPNTILGVNNSVS